MLAIDYGVCREVDVAVASQTAALDKGAIGVEIESYKALGARCQRRDFLGFLT